MYGIMHGKLIKICSNKKKICSHILSALLYFNFKEHQICSRYIKAHEVFKMHYVSIMGLFIWHECLFSMHFNFMVLLLMIIKTHFSPQMVSYLDLLYHSGYHFIKMLNRPVDFSSRFIVVCVAKPLTLKKKKKKRNGHHKAVMSQLWLLSQIILGSQTILLLLRTPVAKVRWDNEKVGRVCQVLAEQLPIFKFLILTQGTHKHRDDAKLVFVAAERDYRIKSISAVTASRFHSSLQWAMMEIKSALIHF